MIELEAQEIVDNEYYNCENCGLLTHEDEMYVNEFYSECVYCRQEHMDDLNREFGYMLNGRRA